MIYFPNAKLNLGLHVTEKRADGFHNLETIFYPIQLSDVLEVLPSTALEFRLSGMEIEGNPEDNLCLKAYHTLNKYYNLPPVYIQLHKIIPTGAGLGGGSADAAFVLKALNSEFKLNLSISQLKKYASLIGSDCAFFIEDKPSIAKGRGEILEPVEVNLAGYFLVIVKPDIHVSTAEAFKNIVPHTPSHALKDIVSAPIDSWKTVLTNDFEKSIFIKYPEIGNIKLQLYDLGAVYAAMSGSGSAVFALFKNEIEDIQTYFNNYYTYTEVLSN